MLDWWLKLILVVVALYGTLGFVFLKFAQYLDIL